MRCLRPGKKNRTLLLQKVFDWLSRWTLEFPITDQKWSLQFVVDLLSEVDSDVAFGVCFHVNDEKLYANVTAASDSKLSEPNLRMMRYTSCSRPDERAVINEEEGTIQLENSPGPIPYEVRLDVLTTRKTQPIYDRFVNLPSLPYHAR